MLRNLCGFLVLLCSAPSADGFVVGMSGRVSDKTTLRHATTQSQTTTGAFRKTQRGELVSFVGDGETRSSYLPARENLLDFFRANRDLFVRNNVPYPNNNNNPAVEKWKQSSQALETEALLVEFRFGFPSLDITSSTVLGSELFHGNGSPEFHFTLLDSTLTAKGAKPLVWLFNQLISDDRIQPASITQVSCIQEPDKVQFVMNGKLQVDIAVPPLMKRHARAAEQVGNQILKSFVQNESKQGLSKFQAAYKRWRD